MTRETDFQCFLAFRSSRLCAFSTASLLEVPKLLWVPRLLLRRSPKLLWVPRPLLRLLLRLRCDLEPVLPPWGTEEVVEKELCAKESEGTGVRDSLKRGTHMTDFATTSAGNAGASRAWLK